MGNTQQTGVTSTPSTTGFDFQPSYLYHTVKRLQFVRALAQVSGDTQNDAEMRAVEILAHISKFKDESAKLIESLRDNIADYEESFAVRRVETLC